jgi:diguanylate cyclase (GGDEF)-like protein
MTEPTTGVLPDVFAHAVRLAPVPLEVRTLLQHLGPWTLDVRLPSEPAGMSLALRQLLKLALLPTDAVQLASVGVADEPCDVALTVSRGGPSIVLGLEELGQELRVLVRRLAAELAEPTDLVEVSEALALALAREQTVRTLSSRMLQAEDLDEALYAMLLGITSGYGASFHRAALFAYDEASRTFRGSIAIGPRDEREAHRVWEAIETEDKTLDQALDDYKTLAGAGDFQQFVRTLALAEAEGDELSTALAAGAPRVFRTPPRNRTLALLLAPATEYVLSVIQPRGTRLGLLVADNAYGRQPIHGAQVESLRALVDPTSLVWDIRSLLRKVDALARHDPLTGLCNRREFEERLAIEHSRCARVQRPISIAVIDVDHFKQVNDTHGHAAGDVLLQRVGSLLRETLRQHDVPSRYGGDEFALMLPDGTKPELIAVTARIGSLARAEGISLSIGGATWPGDCPDPALLLGVADAQLYAAKDAGRCCLCVVGGERVQF